MKFVNGVTCLACPHRGDEEEGMEARMLEILSTKYEENCSAKLGMSGEWDW